MARSTSAVILALVVLFSSGAARSDTPKPNNNPDVLVARERPTTRSFYGWQILATGEVGGVLGAASVFLPGKPLDSAPSTAGFVVGMPLFFLGGPVVHWSHDQFTKGLISLGANAGFSLMGGLAGSSIRCKGQGAPDDCGERGFFAGLAIVSLIVPVVDAVVLGWEDLPVEDVQWTTGRRSVDSPSAAVPLRIAPFAGLGPKGRFNLGVEGRF